MPLEISLLIRGVEHSEYIFDDFPPPPPPPAPPGPVNAANTPAPQRYHHLEWRHALRCMLDRNWNSGTHPLSAAEQGHTETEVLEALGRTRSLRIHTRVFHDAVGWRVHVRATSVEFGFVGELRASRTY